MENETINHLAKIEEMLIKMTENPIRYIPSKEELEMKGKLAKKLALIIEKSGKVEKKGKNIKQNYSYATHADIIEELRKIIAEEGVYILPKPQSYQAKDINSSGGSKGLDIQMKMDFEIIDTETGYSIIVQWFGQGMDYGDKAIYKSYTGALKYFLLDTFMISTGDDPEKENPENVSQQYSNRPTNRTLTGNRSIDQRTVSESVQHSAPQAPAIALISKEQIVRLEKTMKEKGKTPDEVNAYVTKAYAKAKITNYKNLSKIQGEALIKRLEKEPDLQPIDIDPSQEVDPDEADKGISEMKGEKNDKES